MGWPASGLPAGQLSCPGGPHSAPLGQDPQHEVPGLPGTSSHLKLAPALTFLFLAVSWAPSGPDHPPGPLSRPHPVHLGTPLSVPPVLVLVCSAVLPFIRLQKAAPQQPLLEEVGWLLAPPYSSAPALTWPFPSVSGAGLGSPWLSGQRMARLKKEWTDS